MRKEQAASLVAKRWLGWGERFRDLTIRVLVRFLRLMLLIMIRLIMVISHHCHRVLQNSRFKIISARSLFHRMSQCLEGWILTQIAIHHWLDLLACLTKHSSQTAYLICLQQFQRYIRLCNTSSF
jgi:phage-related holin